MPLLDSTRQEFGLTRTVCACKQCSIYCYHLPGFLVPNDVKRMYLATMGPGETIEDWARRTLVASEGAKAVVAQTKQLVRIPTLIPAHKPDGSCQNLTPEGRCGIHDVAPYGCAFADSHMDDRRGHVVSSTGLFAIVDAFADHKSLYRELWEMLNKEGRVPDTLEVRRARLKIALETVNDS